MELRSDAVIRSVHILSHYQKVIAEAGKRGRSIVAAAMQAVVHASKRLSPLLNSAKFTASMSGKSVLANANFP